MFEFKYRVTENVCEVDGYLDCPELGIAVIATEHDALQLGLLSKDFYLAGTRLPHWFTPGAVWVEPGLLRSILQTGLHALRSLSLLLGLGIVFSLIAWFLQWLGIAIVLLAMVILLLSIAVHEVGHVAMLRIRFPTAPAIFVANGGLFSVVRQKLDVQSDVLIAVAGPMAPLLPALLSWALWPFAPFIPIAATLIALGHVAGLALPAGDGETLRQRLRE